MRPEKSIRCDNREFRIISTMRLSAWENFYHVLEPESGREAALVTLKKDKYLKQFEHHIEESEDWEDESKIRPTALEKFEELNTRFNDRYRRLIAIPPHRALPRVFSVFKDLASGQFFAVMEYAHGVPFLIAAPRLSPLQNLGLIHELASGLEHMHGQGLLHRRIKSKNTFIHFEGMKPVAKFSTWGLAVTSEEGEGDRSGAVAFTAPEILTDGKVTQQSDLWSLGSLFYQALTGDPPFPKRREARNIDDLAKIARREPAPKPLAECSAFQKLNPAEAKIVKAEQIEELLQELLKPYPGKREFKSARQVVHFLETHWPAVREGAPE